MNIRSCVAALAVVCLPLTSQDCQAPGILLGSGDDVAFPVQQLGFAFPIGGATYTGVEVSTNGFFYLVNGGLSTGLGSDFSPNAGDLANGPARICPLWMDINMMASNNAGVFIDTSSGTSCTVTWLNGQSYQGATQVQTPFNLSVTIDITGTVTSSYSHSTINNGTGSVGGALIVGVSAGGGVALPAPSDLSVVGASGNELVYEEWPVTGFDLAAQSLSFVPTLPGYAHSPSAQISNCADRIAYGMGCHQQANSIYELMPAAGFDLTSGTTITLLRQGSGYLVLDALPGTYVPPSAAAVAIAPGDDSFQTVTLSTPMPVVGGTTGALTVCSNGHIALSPANNGNDWTPSLAEWLAFAQPAIAPSWHDYTPDATGEIKFEEVAGIAFVTWDNVASFNQALRDTFQVQCELATGNITIVYQFMSNVGNNYLVGYTAGGGNTVAAAYDLSVDLAAPIAVDDVGVAPLDLFGAMPVLGANWDLSTSNIDATSPISITFFGDARLDPGLPFSMIGLAAPGCSIYINTILGDLTGVSLGGVSTVTLAIPNNAALVGAVLTAQSVSLTLLNPANLLASNGFEGVVGY